MLNLSVRKKLLLIFIILFTIPIVVALLILNRYASQFSRYSSKLLNTQSMRATTSAIDQMLGGMYDFSLYLSLNQDMRQFLSVPKEQLYFKNYSYAAQDVISTISFSNSSLKAMSVFGMDDRVISSGTQILTLSQEERAHVIALNGASYWSIQTDAAGKQHIYLLRMLRLPERLKQKLGFIKIELNAQEFENFFATASSDQVQEAYYIWDDKGTLIYRYPSEGNAQADQVLEQFSKEGVDEGSRYFPQFKMYTTTGRLATIPWTICHISEDTYGVSIASTLQKTLFSSMLLCFIFCLLLSSIFSASILAPLRKLGALMQQVGQEDFDVRFHPRGNDEISVLASQFDQMNHQLQTLYNDVYLGQLRLRDAQLAVLQAQINPHFLYNTLDTIYWMSEFNHTSDVSNMISALSQLFRLSLLGDKNDMVPLENELEHIRCYLYIQQIRHAENFAYTITNHTKQKPMVLSLVLQPLIENAILHGIDKVGQGVLQIAIEEDFGNLIYKISDSAGLADPQVIRALLQAPREGLSSKTGAQSMGLRNIHDRIQLRYGEDYGISCNLMDGHTVFTVKLPILPIEEVIQHDKAVDCG